MMQDDLVQLRQAVAQAIATKTRTEGRRTKPSPQQMNGIVAQLALQQTNEPLAREALTKRSYQEQRRR